MKEFDSKLAPPVPANAPQGTPCVLGPTLHFKGELYGEEDLEFQGQIEGSIEHTRSLSIGKEGGVKFAFNMYAKLVYPGQKELGEVNADRLAKLQEFYVAKGFIQKATPVDELYTNAFIK